MLAATEMNDPKEIAKRYFEKYSKVTSITSKVLFITLLIVACNWLFVVEANFSSFKEFDQNFQSQYQQIENELSELKIKSEADTNQYKEKRKQLVAKKDTLTSNRDASLKEKLQNINDWSSLIKFVFFLSDDLKTGAVILVSILSIILFYIFHVRNKCIVYISRALRIYKMERELKINKYKDYNVSAPYWLAPLPSIKNKKITPKELKTLIGWGFTNRYYNLLIYFSFLSILIVELRLLYVTYVVNKSTWNLTLGVGFLFFIASIYLIIYWVAPKKISDNFNYERGANPMSRKDFILTSGFAAISIIGYITIPSIIKLGHRGSPRFKLGIVKPKYLSQNFKRVLTINKKSNIIHFFNSNGYTVCSNAISNISQFKLFENNLENFGDINSLSNSSEGPRLPKGHLSWNSEHITLKLISSQNYSGAAKFLLNSLKQNIGQLNRSYRLYDLLATLCARHPNKIPNIIFEELLDISINSNDKLLVQRARKWKESEWQSKILEKTTYSFNGVKI